MKYRTMTKDGGIDDWMQETIEKAIQHGVLYPLLFTEKGERFREGYPKKKLHAMVLKALRKTK